MKTFTTSLFWGFFTLILLAFALSIPTMTAHAMPPIPWGTEAYPPPVVAVDWQPAINSIVLAVCVIAVYVFSKLFTGQKVTLKEVVEQAVRAVEQMAADQQWNSAEKKSQAVDAAMSLLSTFKIYFVPRKTVELLVEAVVNELFPHPKYTVWDQSDGVEGDADPMKDIEVALSAMFGPVNQQKVIAFIKSLDADENPAEGAQKSFVFTGPNQGYFIGVSETSSVKSASKLVVGDTEDSQQ